MGSVAAIDYKEMENQRQAEILHEFNERLTERTQVSEIDSLTHAILGYVVVANYEMAQSELKRYVDLKESYPSFRRKTDRLVQHCLSIVLAIRSKREFSGVVASGSTAKHQEIFEKIVEHFEELKHYLNKIEIIEKEVKLEDLRSSTIVVKTFFHSLFAVLAILFVHQFVLGGIGQSFLVVLDDLLTRGLTLIFSWF